MIRWIRCYGLLVQIWHILFILLWFITIDILIIDTIVKCNNVWYPPIHITYIPSLIIGANVSLNVVYSIIQRVVRYEDLCLQSTKLLEYSCVSGVVYLVSSEVFSKNKK